MLDAKSVSLDFHVTATGAVAAELRGQLEIRKGGLVTLTGVGSFAGQSVNLSLRADESTWSFGHGSARKSGPRPAAIESALLIGFMRMGILHNLAQLTAGALPDHADGGVKDWVVVDHFIDTEGIPVTTTFNLTVAGEPSGSATLEIDVFGLPGLRQQTVNFPDGEVNVVERYSWVSIKK